MKIGKLHLALVCTFCLVALTYEGCVVHYTRRDDVADKRFILESNAKISNLERQVAMLQNDLEIERKQRAGYSQRAGNQSSTDVDQKILNAVDTYARQYNLPSELVLQVIKRESNFNPKARSSVGAIGLMQIYTKYHKDKMDRMGIVEEEVFEIDNNIRLGCWILREYIDQTSSIDKALTRYVGGKHPSYVKDILVGFTNEMISN